MPSARSPHRRSQIGNRRLCDLPELRRSLVLTRVGHAELGGPAAARIPRETTGQSSASRRTTPAGLSCVARDRHATEPRGASGSHTCSPAEPRCTPHRRSAGTRSTTQSRAPPCFIRVAGSLITTGKARPLSRAPSAVARFRRHPWLLERGACAGAKARDCDGKTQRADSADTIDDSSRNHGRTIPLARAFVLGKPQARTLLPSH